MAAVASLATLNTTSPVSAAAAGRNVNPSSSDKKTPNSIFLTIPKTTIVKKAVVFPLHGKEIHGSVRLPGVFGKAAGGDGGSEPFFPEVFGKAAACGDQEGESDGTISPSPHLIFGKVAADEHEEKSDGTISPSPYQIFGKAATGGDAGVVVPAAGGGVAFV